MKLELKLTIKQETSGKVGLPVSARATDHLETGMNSTLSKSRCVFTATGEAPYVLMHKTL